MSKLMTILMMALLGSLAPAAVAVPPEANDEVWHLHAQPAVIEVQTPENETLKFAMSSLQDEPLTMPFGAKGSQRLNYGGGFALNVKNSDDRHILGGVEWSSFLEDNLSLDLGLNAIFVDQARADAIGGNFTLLLRWHFIAEDTWSLYLDGGAGLIWTTEPVPPAGTKFNFTPQAGIGATFDIGDDRRLMTGFRFHHISNANISDQNPGRDAFQVYMGVSIPF